MDLRDQGLQYFCPRCMGIELDVKRITIAGAPADAQCLLCGWRGSREDLLSTIRPENVELWDAERVAEAMLRAASRTALPLVQTLEMLGLVPPVRGSEEEQHSAHRVRDAVLRRVVEAVVCTSMEAAADLSPGHYQRFSPQQAEVSQRIFRYLGD